MSANFGYLARMPPNGVAVFLKLQMALRSLQAAVEQMTWDQVQTDEGRGKLADLLIAFWNAMREAAPKCKDDDPKCKDHEWRELANTVREWATQNPQAPEASNLLHLGAEITYGGRADRLEEVFEGTKNNLKNYLQFLGTTGDPKIKWHNVRIQIKEYPDALLAALSPLATLQSPTQQRFQVDLASNTITLDRISYNLDPNGCAVVAAYFELKNEGNNGPVSPDRVMARTKFAVHPKTLQRWLNKLPQKIRDCIRSKPGAGRWFELPPLETGT